MVGCPQCVFFLFFSLLVGCRHPLSRPRLHEKGRGREDEAMRKRREGKPVSKCEYECVRVHTRRERVSRKLCSRKERRLEKRTKRSQKKVKFCCAPFFERLKRGRESERRKRSERERVRVRTVCLDECACRRGREGKEAG
ncbi:MAG: hypothetical protein BYD32DRAFT_260357 [Podila humilis]|nr:MAG: hypothetical protein BYD32DRAFT_260357 [Podila humilis]